MSKIYPIMFFLSLVVTLAAVSAIAIYGLNLGVDFRGGSLFEIEFSDGAVSLAEGRTSPEAMTTAHGLPSRSDIEAVLKDGFPDREFSISRFGDNGFILKTGELSEKEHQAVLNALYQEYGRSAVEEKRFDSVGPVIGRELKSRSVTAIIIALSAISIYIAFVFRKISFSLSPWAMSAGALAALAHDIVIPIGIFSVLGRYQGVEIGAVFVAALLTILGYSVSDTVVVFDRVRENVIRSNRGREEFGRLVHKSVIQTLTRSLNTTITTILSLAAIYFFGGESLKYFALAMIIGICLGSYSSIFVASPILVWWHGKFKMQKLK